MRSPSWGWRPPQTQTEPESSKHTPSFHHVKRHLGGGVGAPTCAGGEWSYQIVFIINGGSLQELHTLGVHNHRGAAPLKDTARWCGGRSVCCEEDNSQERIRSTSNCVRHCTHMSSGEARRGPSSSSKVYTNPEHPPESTATRKARGCPMDSNRCGKRRNDRHKQHCTTYQVASRSVVHQHAENTAKTRTRILTHTHTHTHTYTIRHMDMQISPQST